MTDEDRKAFKAWWDTVTTIDENWTPGAAWQAALAYERNRMAGMRPVAWYNKKLGVCTSGHEAGAIPLYALKEIEK